MKSRSFALFSIVTLMTLLCLGQTAAQSVRTAAAPAAPRQTQGSLQVIDKTGNTTSLCPLKHTDVKASVSGFLARVVVTQQFGNPSTEKIEAVYTFPLPQNAAVDDMTIIVGSRTVRGQIKRREEAQAIYDAARAAGHVAGLLDQERPNIFTQSVANIMPGEQVTVKISYLETLRYTDGSYEFVFPMVVGPRYIPGTPTGKSGGGWAPDTNKVPDASRITPPVAADPETATPRRAGHDISLSVLLEAGVTIEDLKSILHEVIIDTLSPHSAAIRLKDQNEIPNKDFILRYKVAGGTIKDSVLAYRGDEGGFFALVLQPPDRVRVQDVTPKELIFVLDSSGSMSGFPIEKAKETMRLALQSLYPRDTFNLMTFSGDTRILFPEPVPATTENLQKAEQFLGRQAGSGGTEMMKAIRAALDPSDAQGHVRIVCFMTDGYVGNDLEIIAEVQKHPNARVFAFGIGNSVNRFLLDQMALQGRGEVEYVSLTEDGSAAARRFHERVRNPLLTDVAINWGGLPVTDVYPKRIPDLFSARPIVICGRYARAGQGVVRLSGNMSGGPFSRDLPVSLPDRESNNNVLAKLWARTRIDDLMSQDFSGAQRGDMQAGLREDITQLGLKFGLMTQYTSFVAVEEMTITEGGKPRRIEVPVEMPDGVSYRGVFGDPRGPSVLAFAAPSKSMMAGGAARQQAAIPVAAETMDAVSAVTPQDLKRIQAAAKLHPAIAALIERLRKQDSKPGAEEARFVRDGKAEIQIWLAEKNAAVLAELKRLGFEIMLEPRSANLLIGRLPVTGLAALAELATVRYIAPSQAR
jgi:Ca-activated chloride channel family protein